MAKDGFLTRAKDAITGAAADAADDPAGFVGGRLEEAVTDPLSISPFGQVLKAGEAAREFVFPEGEEPGEQSQQKELPEQSRFTANEALQPGSSGAGNTVLPLEAEAYPAKKGAGAKTAFEVEASAPIPDWLNQLNQRSMKRMADWDYLDKMTRAHALGAVGDLQKELAHQTDKQYGKSMKDMGQLLDTAEQEIAAVDDLIDAARSNRINPGQFFANVGEAGKFAAALSVGAGAMASAFGGGPNVAFEIIQKAIDRNVRAQVVNQAHDRAMISHQLNFVHAIRGLAQDQGSYGNLIRLGLNAVAQARIAEVMTGANSVLYANAGRSVYDRLNAQVIQARINQIASTKYKFKHSWNNWRKTLAIQQSVLGAMSGGGVPQRGGRRAPAELGPGQEPRRGTAPSAGGGEAQQTTGPNRTVTPKRKQDRELVDRALQKALTTPAFQQRGPRAAEAQAQAIADALQEEASNIPGQKITREMKQYAWETFGDSSGAGEGAAPELATAIKGTSDLEFVAPGQVPSRNIFIPGIGKTEILIENVDQYNESNKKRTMERISSGARVIAYTKELKRLARGLNLGNKLSDVVRTNEKGERVYPLFDATITETQMMSKIKGIQEVLITEAQNLEVGQNTLNRIWEIGRKERQTGARPSIILELGDISGARTVLQRVKEMDSYIELADDAMRGAATAAGLYIPGNFKPVLEKRAE